MARRVAGGNVSVSDAAASLNDVIAVWSRLSTAKARAVAVTGKPLGRYGRAPKAQPGAMAGDGGRESVSPGRCPPPASGGTMRRRVARLALNPRDYRHSPALPTAAPGVSVRLERAQVPVRIRHGSIPSNLHQFRLHSLPAGPFGCVCEGLVVRAYRPPRRRCTCQKPSSTLSGHRVAGLGDPWITASDGPGVLGSPGTGGVVEWCAGEGSCQSGRSGGSFRRWAC